MPIWHRIVGGLAAAWVTAGLVSAASAEPLRLRYNIWVGFGPLFVAEEKGFFAREGVEVELIRIDDHTAALAALFAGQVDALATASQEVVAFTEPGDEPLAGVLALDASRGADGIVAANDIQSIADLRGKSVAFIDRSVSQFHVNVLLRQVGLSQADIEVVDLPPDKAAEAFMLGEVDAAAVGEPYLSQGTSVAHGHLLTDTSEQPGLLTDCLAAKPSTFDQRKDEFRALARAWATAVDYVDAHPEDSSVIMTRHLGDGPEDAAIFARGLKGIKLYDAAGNREYFGTPEKPGQIYQMMQYAIDVWSDLGMLNVKLKPADVIAHGILDE